MQAVIDTLGHGCVDRTYWHCIRLRWPQPRGGIRAITILSMHVSNIQAKKPVGGPRAVAATLDEALAQSPEIDLVTGDFNGARQAGMFVVAALAAPAWPPSRLPVPAPLSVSFARYERHCH